MALLKYTRDVHLINPKWLTLMDSRLDNFKRLVSTLGRLTLQCNAADVTDQ